MPYKMVSVIWDEFSIRDSESSVTSNLHENENDVLRKAYR